MGLFSYSFRCPTLLWLTRNISIGLSDMKNHLVSVGWGYEFPFRGLIVTWVIMDTILIICMRVSAANLLIQENHLEIFPQGFNKLYPVFIFVLINTVLIWKLQLSTIMCCEYLEIWKLVTKNDVHLQQYYKTTFFFIHLNFKFNFERRQSYISEMDKKADLVFGLFNPTPINRANNVISNTYRLTYKCHTFLETSGQGLPI